MTKALIRFTNLLYYRHGVLTQEGCGVVSLYTPMPSPEQYVHNVHLKRHVALFASFSPAKNIS